MRRPADGAARHGVEVGFTTVQIDGVAWRMFSARGAENTWWSWW
jgi:hypothetical protein